MTKWGNIRFYQYMYEICQNTWDQRTQAVRYIILLCLQLVSTLFYSYQAYKCIITEPNPSMNENKDQRYTIIPNQ